MRQAEEREEWGASFEGGQGPEGAVAPYTEWNGAITLIFLPKEFLKHGERANVFESAPQNRAGRPTENQYQETLFRITLQNCIIPVVSKVTTTL